MSGKRIYELIGVKQKRCLSVTSLAFVANKK